MLVDFSRPYYWLLKVEVMSAAVIDCARSHPTRHNVTHSFDAVVFPICAGLLLLFTIVLLTARPAQCQVAMRG